MGHLDDDIIPNEDAPRPRVVALRQVSSEFLVQWEGRTDDERPIYIRFKDYHVSVRIGDVGGDMDSARFAKPWFDVEDVDVIDYWTISLDTVCGLTGVIVDCTVEQQARV
jgi:hypothetical protein